MKTIEISSRFFKLLTSNHLFQRIFFHGNAKIYSGVNIKLWNIFVLCLVSRKIFTKWKYKITTNLQPIVKLDAIASKTTYHH